ncbi:MAG: peptidoglycan editing factor PgeF [Patescibacteria group bacterium]|nr:peptidoglycan editing factor PgeF [Patescibacteria group bacterium]
MLFSDKDQRFFYSSFVDKEKFFAGFFTRNFGDGRQKNKLITFLRQNQITFRKIIVPQQIHSANIVIVDHFQTSFLIEKVDNVDGLITGVPGVVLTVISADCLPIIYLDEKKPLIGISHQGWRGSLKRLPQKMIDTLLKIGANRETLKVLLGPSIGQCCYDIDEDRYHNFRQEFETYSKEIFQWIKGSWHLCLLKLNYSLIIEMGISPNNIDFFPFCTACDKKRFFSFRRLRKRKKNDRGEMISAVAIITT